MILIPWIVLAVIVAQIGKTRKIGYTKALLNSIFLTPIIGILIVLASRPLTSSEIARPDVNKLSSMGVTFLHRGQYAQALELFKKAYSLDKTNQTICFNLGVTYSLMKNAEEAFFYLQKAIENGYNDFEKIKSSDHLHYVQQHPSFPAFVAAGFKLVHNSMPGGSTIPDRFQAIEKLADLKNKGLLSSEEFEDQKKKILEQGFL